MLIVRKRDDIFQIDGGWFQGNWHFSFGGPEGFYDLENTQFGHLRVFNIDTIIPGGAWPLHPHRDIEVITYVLDGAFQHGDQNGRDGVLRMGDVQHTTVGSGLYHEEVNFSPTEPMTFLQIWVLPRRMGLKPAMEQRHVERSERLNKFLTLVSNKVPNALPIQQDAAFVVAALEQGKTLSFPLTPGEGGYFYVVSGQATVNGQTLSQGDAAKVFDEAALRVEAVQESELVMVVTPLGQDTG